MEYKSVWTDELDKFVFENLKQLLLEGSGLTEAFAKTGKEINASKYIVNNRWYKGNKYRKPLCELLSETDKNAIKRIFDQKRLETLKSRIRKNDKNRLIESESLDQTTSNGTVFDTDKEYNKQIEITEEIYKQMESNLGEIGQTIANKLSETFKEELSVSNAEVLKLRKEIVDSNKLLKNTVTSLIENFNLEVKKIRSEVQSHNEIVHRAFSEKIKVLENEKEQLTLKNKKLSTANRKADKYISQFVMSKAEENEKLNSSFKMERNGNLISVN